jgi:hypothetical protein
MLLVALLATGMAANAAQTEADTQQTVDTQAADAAEVDLTPTAAAAGNRPIELPSGLGDFCFFAHLPPADQKYTVVKKLKVGKGTYGGVSDILPKLAENARTRGADAIIEYSGAQHFGFWPWRMVRPVVHGVAVKWTGSTPDCEASGGTKLSTILSTNQAPEK